MVPRLELENDRCLQRKRFLQSVNTFDVVSVGLDKAYQQVLQGLVCHHAGLDDALGIVDPAWVTLQLQKKLLGCS